MKVYKFHKEVNAYKYNEVQAYRLDKCTESERRNCLDIDAKVAQTGN